MIRQMVAGESNPAFARHEESHSRRRASCAFALRQSAFARRGGARAERRHHRLRDPVDPAPIGVPPSRGRPCFFAPRTYDRAAAWPATPYAFSGASRRTPSALPKETIMVAAVRVHKTGGPEVLTYEDIEIGAPGPGQIRVRHHACGINYIDTYFRSGLYPAPSMPFVAGNEGAGEVTAVGEGVKDLKPGDRVAYVHAMGGYAGERLLPAERTVKLPGSISYEQAAGMMLKGMTVQYLLRRTFK